jgi:hypothetical protein
MIIDSREIKDDGTYYLVQTGQLFETEEIAMTEIGPDGRPRETQIFVNEEILKTLAYCPTEGRMFRLHELKPQ